MKKKLTFLLALLSVLLIFTGCHSKAEPTVPQTTAELQADTQWGRTVVRDGITYRYNSHMRSVLFLGVDSKAEAEQHAVLGTGGRSDTIILLVIDPDAKTIRMMPISRDTITEIDIYDSKGEFLFNGTMQITMQYAFGSSPAQSCRLTKKTVSELLLDLPITSYCSLTLDGIAAGVNLIGGVEVTFPEDWTDIDPAYTKGATVKMDASQVEAFLRYRDTSTLGSNNARMERQSWFARYIFSKMIQSGQLGTDLMLKILDPYLETDMDGDTISQLTGFTLEETPIVLPGKNVAGSDHDEFYLDPDALEALLLEVYYQQVEN